ncbi:hypothetical protein [Paenibacillus taichungensis]
MRIVGEKRFIELTEKELQLGALTEGLGQLREIFSIAEPVNKELSPVEMLSKAVQVVADHLNLPVISFTLFTEQTIMPSDIMQLTLDHFTAGETEVRGPIRAEGVPQRVIIRTRNKLKLDEYIERIGNLSYTIE